MSKTWPRHVDFEPVRTKMECELKTVPKLSNGTIFNDLK